jgi:hypothetical protein
VTGAALLAALALAGLYPVALAVAAVLVPLLVLVYLWSVDAYEEEPARVLGLTILWGAAAGVGLGVLTGTVQARHAELVARTTAHSVAWNGVVLPLLALALSLPGPLVLLPYRRFDDTVDGVAFGSASAVALAGAALLARSSTFLSDGLAPVGATTPWVLRLLTLGVVVPVITAAAVGAAAGALWLRFRAPARDRGALGALGHPVPALLLAAAALVGAGLLQLYLDRWAALAALAGVAAGCVLWLRQLIHVGLVEEAARREEAGRTTCAECGLETPRLGFCAHCGVALAALPKRGAGRSAAAALALGLALASGAAAAAVAAARPSPPRPPCVGRRHCAGTLLVPALVDGAVWRSSSGTQLEYDPTRWSASNATADSIVLTSSGPIGGLDVRVFVAAEPAASTSLVSELGAARSTLTSLYPTLAPDLPANQPLTPAIGSAFGIGEADAGTTADERNPVEAMLLAASRDDVDVLVAAWTDNAHALGGSGPYPTFAVVDQILETFRWPSEAVS